MQANGSRTPPKDPRLSLASMTSSGSTAFHCPHRPAAIAAGKRNWATSLGACGAANVVMSKVGENRVTGAAETKSSRDAGPMAPASAKPA